MFYSCKVDYCKDDMVFIFFYIFIGLTNKGSGGREITIIDST